jgi:hypothetical protein
VTTNPPSEQIKLGMQVRFDSFDALSGAATRTGVQAAFPSFESITLVQAGGYGTTSSCTADRCSLDIDQCSLDKKSRTAYSSMCRTAARAAAHAKTAAAPLLGSVLTRLCTARPKETRASRAVGGAMIFPYKKFTPIPEAACIGSHLSSKEQWELEMSRLAI